ncbi:hypothetical protein [Asanoa sp. NPDC050611]|uniref:hypothetical protein n=1 Tax=Asanoa sp. NPDC050611 TaxID=3157098 RepID=UPI0033EBE7E1
MTLRGRSAAVAALVLVAGLAGCSSPERAAAPSASPTPDPVAAVSQQINAALTAQSRALNNGDQAGFLAPAGGNAKLRATLKRRFSGLRALEVAGVEQSVTQGPSVDAQPGKWHAQIRFDYCLGGTGCGIQGPVMTSTWQETSMGIQLVELGGTSHGPRPWEVDDLAVLTGKRVTVASTRAQAAKLRAVLPIAEKAAKVADTYAVAGSRPFRYVVYLADRSRWKAWYENDTFDASYSGYALQSEPEGTDLVLRLDAYADEDPGTLLRHEMTHLASTSHAPRNGLAAPTWWLNEGIAELAGANGTSPRDYPGRAAVRDFLRGTPSYKGSLVTVATNDDDSDEVISAKYGLAYYASRCIDEKYGRKRLLTLADDLLRNDVNAAVAAPTALGANWATVESTCFAYTRRAVAL